MYDRDARDRCGTSFPSKLPNIECACMQRLSRAWTPATTQMADRSLRGGRDVKMLTLAPHHLISATWPTAGRHILAAHDDESVTVYQAYSPAIGRFASSNGYFGGPAFSLSRMSWIKPNFLWMMYRSGWGTKENREVTLAVRLRRSAFDAILGAAVPSTYSPELFIARADWEHTLKTSQVRLQWNPDHDPAAVPLERRAIQLGLRGEFLARYTREWIRSVEDISTFVADERSKVGSVSLQVPAERVYRPGDPDVVRRLGL